MTDQEAIERAAVVAAARCWLGTPYRHKAAVLGAGVDCARIILEAFSAAGLSERFDLGNYTHDWHLHRGEEKYLAVVEQYMALIDGSEVPLKDRTELVAALPGDVIVFQQGRTFSHGVIVTDWPWIIHSYYPARMVEEVEVLRTPMAEKKMRLYSYWGTR